MEITAKLDPAQLAKVKQGARRFGPALQKSLQRRLRRSAEQTVTDMQGVVRGGPGSGRVGIRRGIATGLRTVDAPGGVRIEASSGSMPPGREPMLRAYNKSSFRHPVFARPGRARVEVQQSGRPFFGTTIRRHENTIRDAAGVALNDAVKETIA